MGGEGAETFSGVAGEGGDGGGGELGLEEVAAVDEVAGRLGEFTLDFGEGHGIALGAAVGAAGAVAFVAEGLFGEAVGGEEVGLSGPEDDVHDEVEGVGVHEAFPADVDGGDSEGLEEVEQGVAVEPEGSELCQELTVGDKAEGGAESCHGFVVRTCFLVDPFDIFQGRWKRLPRLNKRGILRALGLPAKP